MKDDLVAVPRALLNQLHDHYCGPKRSDPVADPMWAALGAHIDGCAELPDRYTKLAHAMDCTEAEVPHRIQEHAPWNGRAHCEAERIVRLETENEQLRAKIKALHALLGVP